MKATLFGLMVLIITLILSCQTEPEVYQYQNYTQTVYPRQGNYSDSVTLSFLGHQEDGGTGFPLVIVIDGNTYLPDTLGVMTVYEAPNEITGKVVVGALYDEVPIIPFKAHAGDSIHFDVILKRSNYEYIQNETEF